MTCWRPRCSPTPRLRCALLHCCDVALRIDMVADALMRLIAELQSTPPSERNQPRIGSQIPSLCSDDGARAQVPPTEAESARFSTN